MTSTRAGGEAGGRARERGADGGPAAGGCWAAGKRWAGRRRRAELQARRWAAARSVPRSALMRGGDARAGRAGAESSGLVQTSLDRSNWGRVLRRGLGATQDFDGSAGATCRCCAACVVPRDAPLQAFGLYWLWDLRNEAMVVERL